MFLSRAKDTGSAREETRAAGVAPGRERFHERAPCSAAPIVEHSVRPADGCTSAPAWPSWPADGARSANVSYAESFTGRVIGLRDFRWTPYPSQGLGASWKRQKHHNRRIRPAMARMVGDRAESAPVAVDAVAAEAAGRATNESRRSGTKPS